MNKKIYLVCIFFIFCGFFAYKYIGSTNLISKPKGSVLVFVAMAKSGSVFIANTLAKSLDFNLNNFSYTHFPKTKINKSKMAEIEQQILSGKGVVTRDHLDPSEANMKAIRQFSNKMVFHVRHPLQAVISSVHHESWTEETNYSSKVTPNTAPDMKSLQTPPGFYKWSLSKKIDWEIDNGLPELNSWLLEWMEYIEKSKSGDFKILVTHYEDFKKDEAAFYKKILDFFRIPQTMWNFLPLPKTKEYFFRKGETDEWRAVMTKSQIQRAKSKLDPKVLAYFGYTI